MSQEQVLYDLDMVNVSRVLNLPDALLPQEPATLAQLKAQVRGLKHKASARVTTVSNINLASPGATIDGVSMVVGDRFLPRVQSDQTENGIYIWNGAATPATRAPDADTADSLETAVVVIEESGTTYARSVWIQETVNFTLGVGNIVWSEFGSVSPAATETTAGIAEIATQGEADAGVDDTRMLTPQKAKNASWAVKTYGALFGDGASLSYVITHNLGTRRVKASVSLVGSPYSTVHCGIERTTINSVTVFVNVAPASNAYEITLST